MLLKTELAIAEVLTKFIEVNRLDETEKYYLDAKLGADRVLNDVLLWECVAWVFLRRGYSPLGQRGRFIQDMLKKLQSDKKENFERSLEIDWGG